MKPEQKYGGAVLDFAENISRGQDHWREPYNAHGEQKRNQINLMIRYAEGNECRMSTLVRHFGDLRSRYQKPNGQKDQIPV